MSRPPVPASGHRLTRLARRLPDHLARHLTDRLDAGRGLDGRVARLRQGLAAVGLLSFAPDVIGGALAPTAPLALVAALALNLAPRLHRRWTLPTGLLTAAVCLGVGAPNDLPAMSHHRWLLASAFLWLGLAHSARGALVLLRVQLSLLYLCAGFDKLAPAWRDGTRLLEIAAHTDPGRAWLHHPASLWLAPTLNAATVALELLLAAGLWWRPLRPTLVVLGLGFHTLIQLNLPVGVFGPLMAVLYLAWLPLSPAPSPPKRANTG